MIEEVSELALLISSYIKEMDLQDSVECLNEVREILHDCSPFQNEPVDFVKWVLADDIKANDYNPNSVAPPEMKLLELSITNDGYTQPIVSWPCEGFIEVVDGFHRHRVGTESKAVSERIQGYLPIVSIKASQQGHNDRVASTIRHNRARGKHRVEAMSDIVLDLKRRNWSPKKIAKELGMDQDEVLRLAQITGLAEMFQDSDFSEAWEAELLTDNDFTGDTENLD